jgi:hypothetical protein
MKIIGLLSLWLVALAASAQTNQGWRLFRDPVRVFTSRTAVDLTPLYQWWARQPGHSNATAFVSAKINVDTNAPLALDRPLAAWHLVTGSHVSTIGSSWVVDAVIYTGPNARTNARVILTHPPNGEEKDYLTLKQQFAEADVEITNAYRTYKANLKAEQEDQRLENEYARSRSKVGPDSARNFAWQAQQRQADATAAASQQQQLETLRTQIQQQLKAIPAMNGTYHIDWFAVMLGYSKQGLPVYDLGVVKTAVP